MSETKYDAVLCTRLNYKRALELCKTLSNEEMAARRKKWPWTRNAVAEPFDGFMVRPSWYAVACLTYDDYTWQEIEPELCVGTIKDGAMDRIAKHIEYDKKAESDNLKALAERDQEEQQTVAQWEAARAQLEADYWVGLADLCGINANLPADRIAKALMLLKTLPDVRPLSEVLDMAGPKPLTAPEWPEEAKHDYFAYCDYILANLVRNVNKVA